MLDTVPVTIFIIENKTDRISHDINSQRGCDISIGKYQPASIHFFRNNGKLLF